jgi:hypothetical protein
MAPPIELRLENRLLAMRTSVVEVDSQCGESKARFTE